MFRIVVCSRMKSISHVLFLEVNQKLGLRVLQDCVDVVEELVLLVHAQPQVFAFGFGTLALHKRSVARVLQVRALKVDQANQRVLWLTAVNQLVAHQLLQVDLAGDLLESG